MFNHQHGIISAQNYTEEGTMVQRFRVVLTVCAAAVVCVVLGVASAGSAEEKTQEKKREHGKDFAVFPPEEIEWKDAEVLPPGAKLAVLEGDPTKDGPFVMRIKLPDGYRVPPHTHPKTERLTVISGTFSIGMGETFDASKGRKMPAGTFGYWAAGMKHYVWATGETVVQLHGIGPWQIQYVNPSDDPRRAKK
jgi:quercetin dioxygenase-like cupin family protein